MQQLKGESEIMSQKIELIQLSQRLVTCFDTAFVYFTANLTINLYL